MSEKRRSSIILLFFIILPLIFYLFPSILLHCQSINLIHLMYTTTQARTSTRATSLMGVKNNMHHKTTSWIVDHFSLTFVNLFLTWMLYFHVWLQYNGKVLVCREQYNQFGICQFSIFRVSLLVPQQNNYSNPEAYLEPCQTSKIE